MALLNISNATTPAVIVLAIILSVGLLLTLGICTAPLLLAHVLVTTGAENKVVGLIIHQQVRLAGTVRLVTRAAVHLHADFRDVRHVHLVLHRMLINGMPEAILDGQDGHEIEILARQPYLAVKDRHDLLALDFLRLRIRTMALKAEFVDVARTQQIGVIAAVRFVTGEAPLSENWLVRIFLFVLLRLVGVAGETYVYRIGFLEARRFTRVR